MEQAETLIGWIFDSFTHYGEALEFLDMVQRMERRGRPIQEIGRIVVSLAVLIAQNHPQDTPKQVGGRSPNW